MPIATFLEIVNVLLLPQTLYVGTCRSSECGAGDNPHRYGIVHLICQKNKDSAEFHFLEEKPPNSCRYVRIMSNIMCELAICMWSVSNMPSRSLKTVQTTNVVTAEY